jgi:hypothetical protein
MARKTTASSSGLWTVRTANSQTEDTINALTLHSIVFYFIYDELYCIDKINTIQYVSGLSLQEGKHFNF